MNVNELLDTIEDALEEGANVPLSGGKKIVDVEQIRDYLDEIRANLPGELRQAQQIVNDRSQIVETANARQTDLYIEQLLNSTGKGGHRISMVKDVRIFVNTIDHAIRLMTDNGVPATAHREEKDGYIEYTVRIPTAAAER